MRLKDTELDTVVDALLRGVPTKDSLRGWLANGYTSVVHNVPEVANVRADARAIVMRLDEVVPEALLKLLTDVGEGNRDVKAISLSYQAAVQPPVPAGAGPPWQQRLLARRAVFLDRRELRSAIGNLVNAQVTSLVVRGPTKSGKTWTAELIRHVAGERGDGFAHVPNAATVGVAATVESILSRLGDSAAHVPAIASPDAHWYNQQCNRILDVAGRARGQLSWIVVDRMGEESAPTTELCNTLLEAVATSLTKARVVLLGYPRSSPPDTVPAHTVEWDDLGYGRVERTDVRDFIEWLYREVVGQPLTTAALETQVEAIIGGRTPASPDFLESAGREILQRTRRALEGRNGR